MLADSNTVRVCVCARARCGGREKTLDDLMKDADGTAFFFFFFLCVCVCVCVFVYFFCVTWLRI